MNAEMGRNDFNLKDVVLFFLGVFLFFLVLSPEFTSWIPRSDLEDSQGELNQVKFEVFDGGLESGNDLNTLFVKFLKESSLSDKGKTIAYGLLKCLVLSFGLTIFILMLHKENGDYTESTLRYLLLTTCYSHLVFDLSGMFLLAPLILFTLYSLSSNRQVTFCVLFGICLFFLPALVLPCFLILGFGIKNLGKKLFLCPISLMICCGLKLLVEQSLEGLYQNFVVLWSGHSFSWPEFSEGVYSLVYLQPVLFVGLLSLFKISQKLEFQNLIQILLSFVGLVIVSIFLSQQDEGGNLYVISVFAPVLLYYWAYFAKEEMSEIQKVVFQLLMVWTACTTILFFILNPNGGLITNLNLKDFNFQKLLAIDLKEFLAARGPFIFCILFALGLILLSLPKSRKLDLDPNKASKESHSHLE